MKSRWLPVELIWSAMQTCRMPGRLAKPWAFLKCRRPLIIRELLPGAGMDSPFNLAKCSPSVNFLWIGGRSEDVCQWQTRLSQAGIRMLTLTGFIDNQHLPEYQAALTRLHARRRLISVSGGGNTADICSPIKMFEYMACHRPIISSDLPVLRGAQTLRMLSSVQPEIRLPGEMRFPACYQTPY